MQKMMEVMTTAKATPPDDDSAKRLKRSIKPPQQMKICQLDQVDHKTLRECGMIEKVPGDVNCLFASLGKLLAHYQEQPRSWTATEMRQALQVFASNPMWRDEVAGTLDCGWDEWLCKMNGDGSSRNSWGDETAAIILCGALTPKRRLYIYNAKESRLIHISWPGQEMTEPVVLWFSGNAKNNLSDHYDAFWVDGGASIPEVTEDIVNWKAKWSGGGN